MKKNKYFFLAIAFFLSQFSAFAQTFEIKYYLSDFTITAGADSVVTVTSKHRSFYGGDMQSPRLPFLSANILCSRGTVECNPTFSYEKEPIATGVLLHTLPPVYPTSVDPATINYEPQIARTSQSKPYNYGGVGHMMGYSFARISLSPFEYDYDTRTLYFIKSFVITVNERVQPQTIAANAKKPRLGDPKFVSDLVLNSAEISAMYPAPQEVKKNDIMLLGNYAPNDSIGSGTGVPNPGDEYGGVADPSEDEEYIVDYLIVTSSDLKSAFERLAQWKKARGLNPEIITVDSLSSLQIKEKIYDYYQQFGPMWVLLAGDETNIPARECLISDSNFYDDPSDRYTPYDLYYACFDNLESELEFSDPNGDNYVVDLYPEVHLSRLSVRTLEQAEAIVDKIIYYERYDFLLSSYNSDKVLFFGVKTHWFTNNPANTSIAETISDSHRFGVQIMNGIKEACGYDKFDYCFDTGNNVGYPKPLTSVAGAFSTLIDMGYGIVHIASHGSETTLYGYDSESNPFFDIKRNGLSGNNTLPIIATIACETNHFNSKIEPCLSEVMTRAEYGGAIAYFGPSRDGVKVADVDYVSGSYLYNAYFIYSIIADKLSIGEALTRAKIACNDQILNDTEHEDLYYYLTLSTNLLGDPELRYYPDLQEIQTEITKITSDAVSVSIPTELNGDVWACLYDPDSVNGFFARKRCKGGDIVSFPISSLKNMTPISLQLVVSKNGYAPYIQDIFISKIVGDVVINNNPSGEFYIQDLPSNYYAQWNISKDEYTTAFQNYFTLSNADQKICSVKYNRVTDMPVYGIDKTTLSAQICYYSIPDNYCQPVEGIDIVYLGEFTGSFLQESSDDYPGIDYTRISAEFDLYSDAVDPGEETGDSCVVEIPDEPVVMSARQMKALSSSGVSPNSPIYVYPKGKVVLKSEFFKYLSCELNTPTANANVDFSKYEDGEITFEMGGVNEVLPLKFERGGNVKNTYLNFISVELDTPTLTCMNANGTGFNMALYVPKDMGNGNWTYEIYDMTTSMYVHNETVPYSATRTLNYTPQLYHTYLISARNADNDVYVTTKVIVNN